MNDVVFDLLAVCADARVVDVVDTHTLGQAAVIFSPSYLPPAVGEGMHGKYGDHEQCGESS